MQVRAAIEGNKVSVVRRDRSEGTELVVENPRWEEGWG